MAPRTTQLVTVPLLRYRFDATARMDKHFHEMEGRTLFFFPATPVHKDGAWVFVAFSNGGSCCLFRGRVRTQDSARFVGFWVEFPVVGMAGLLKYTTKSRRSRERLAADVTVVIRRTDGARALCRIADVSAEGARLNGLPALLSRGDEVAVDMIGGSRGQSDLGTAEVVWVRTQEAGLKFARAGTGRTSLLTVVAQAEAAKSATAEVAHAAACACRHGEGPAEPALPASAYRKAEAR
ncbi:MAG: PilZ domain-containing protein [Myxococcales bacterium]